VAESMKPDAAALPVDPQLVQGWLKDDLNDLVSTKRPIPAIHEHEFMRMVNEVTRPALRRRPVRPPQE
jgi:hypothetical protein